MCEHANTLPTTESTHVFKKIKKNSSNRIRLLNPTGHAFPPNKDNIDKSDKKSIELELLDIDESKQSNDNIDNSNETDQFSQQKMDTNKKTKKTHKHKKFKKTDESMELLIQNNTCNNKFTELEILDIDECKEKNNDSNNDNNNDNCNKNCFVELPWKLTYDRIKHFPKYHIEIIDLNTYKHPKYPDANVMLLFYHKETYDIFSGNQSKFQKFFERYGFFHSLKTLHINCCRINEHRRYAVVIQNSLNTAEDIKHILITYAYFPASMIQIMKPQFSKNSI